MVKIGIFVTECTDQTMPYAPSPITSSTRYALSTTKCSRRWSILVRVSDFGTLSLTMVSEAAHVFYGQPATTLPPQRWSSDTMPQHILTALGMLQAQFAAFQDTLGAVSSDVKDALSQLHALRTAQNKTDRSVAELEGVFGVSTRGRARRGRGRGRGGADALLHADGTDPERTSVAAIEALLARDGRASRSREWHSSCFESTPDRPTDLPVIHRDAPQSDSSLSLSSIAIPSSESETPPPAAKGSFVCMRSFSAPPDCCTEYADASIHACPLSPPSSPPSSLPHSYGLTLVDWRVDPGKYMRTAVASVHMNSRWCFFSEAWVVC